VKPVAFVNPASGSGSGDDDVEAWCEAVGVERREIGDDFEAALADAAAEGPPYIAVVGGDGTVRTAAGVLGDSEVPLLAAPGGTFNHFAKSLGIADLDTAAAAARAGIVRTATIAEVNGQVFVNTCAIGWYPEMVRTRERLRERLPRPLAALGAFARHVPRLHRFDVVVGGTAHRVWLLWAGNGRFGTTPATLAERDAIDDGVLDVRLALAHRRFARTQVVWDLVRGRLRHSEQLERFVVDGSVTARLRDRSVVAALDAEVVDLTSPLTFTPAARRLRVLVAPPD
jgi:undecaprenyl-diphosphatase